MPYDAKVEPLELPHLRFNLVVLITDPAHHGVAEAGDLQWQRMKPKPRFFRLD